MHQYKTLAQTLFVLSVLNSVFAAPAVSQDVHDGRNDVESEDVIGLSETRRGLPGAAPGTPPDVPPGGATLGHYLSSTLPDGSPMPNLSEMDDVPLRDPATPSSAPVHPPSAADGGTAHVLGSNTGASTSSGPSPATNRPVSGPGSTAEGSTTAGYTQVTHDMLTKDPKFYQKPLVKKVAGFGLMTAFVASLVLFEALNNRNNKDE